MQIRGDKASAPIARGAWTVRPRGPAAHALSPLFPKQTSAPGIGDRPALTGGRPVVALGCDEMIQDAAFLAPGFFWSLSACRHDV